MKVMLVDDDVIALTALREALSTQGRLKFAEFEDGNAAWKALDEGLAPALFLFDVRIPGIDGVELLAKVRHDPRFSGIPAMIITSTAAREVVMKASGLGLEGLLVKPVEGRQLTVRVFPVLNAFIESLLSSPARTRQKLRLDPKRYVETIEGLIRKGQEAIACLRGPHSEDTTRRALGHVAAIRNLAQMLGAAHLEGSMSRAWNLVDGQTTESKKRQAAGVMEVGLALFRDGLEWNNVEVKMEG